MTQPLYFTPGLMCDERLWQNLWPQLSNHFDPIHIPFGLHHTMPPMLDDITRNLDLDPADLIGFSMGGYLALRYALEHPGAIKRLIIIGATGSGLTEEEQIRRDFILNSVKSNPYAGITSIRMKQFVHPNNLDGSPSTVIRAMDKSLGKETLIAQMTATSQRASLLEQLHALDFPVLVVGAQQDQLVKTDEILRLAEYLPNAHIKVIQNSGHMCPLEAPEQLAKVINTFLAETA